MKAVKKIIQLLLILVPSYYCEKPVVNLNVYTSESNTQTVRVGLDEVLQAKLQGNPTTGYRWFVNSNSNTISALNLNSDKSTDDYVMDTHEEGMVGVGGTYTFKFEPKEVGKSNVEFVYKRSWEENSAVTTVNLEVITDDSSHAGNYQGVPDLGNSTNSNSVGLGVTNTDKAEHLVASFIILIISLIL